MAKLFQVKLNSLLLVFLLATGSVAKLLEWWLFNNGRKQAGGLVNLVCSISGKKVRPRSRTVAIFDNDTV